LTKTKAGNKKNNRLIHGIPQVVSNDMLLKRMLSQASG